MKRKLQLLKWTPLQRMWATKICDCNTPDPHQNKRTKKRSFTIRQHIDPPGLSTYTRAVLRFKPLRLSPASDGRISWSLEILKSLAPLEEMTSVLVPLRSKVFFSCRGENGPWWTRRAGGKVWNHFGSENGQHCELWAISHPVAWSKWPISKVPPDL